VQYQGLGSTAKKKRNKTKSQKEEKETRKIGEMTLARAGAAASESSVCQIRRTRGQGWEAIVGGALLMGLGK
jgi:hypothetical protein